MFMPKDLEAEMLGKVASVLEANTQGGGNSTSLQGRGWAEVGNPKRSYQTRPAALPALL